MIAEPSLNDKRELILEAAFHAFSEKGYSDASNLEIARAAGLKSVGLLNYYFPHKIDLFKAVIRRFSPPMQLLSRAEELMERPPQEVLPQMVGAYVDLIQHPQGIAFMRLVMSEAIRSREFGQQVFDQGPNTIFVFLESYMAAQMELGNLRRANPMLAARSLIGPVLSLAMQQIVKGSAPAAGLDKDEIVTEVVRNFFEGMNPA